MKERSLNFQIKERRKSESSYRPRVTNTVCFVSRPLSRVPFWSLRLSCCTLMTQYLEETEHLKKRREHQVLARNKVIGWALLRQVMPWALLCLTSLPFHHLATVYIPLRTSWSVRVAIYIFPDRHLAAKCDACIFNMKQAPQQQLG